MFATTIALLLAAAPLAAEQRFESPSGTLSLALGRLSEPLPGKLGPSARAHALLHRDALGLPATSTLSGAEPFGTRFGASFHLRQQVLGYEVHDARVVVTVDRNRRVMALSSNVVPYRQAVVDWKVSAGAAMEIAARTIPYALLQNDGRPYGGYKQLLFPVGEDVHAGYLVWVPTVNPVENWYVAVDATDGKVLFTRNRVFTAADDAHVYESSPGGLDAGVGRTPVVVRQLRHADGGSMIGPTAEWRLPDGGTFITPNDAGHLFGTQLVAYGCCPHESCSTAPDAGPRHAKGRAQVFGFNIGYDVAICDRLHRAANGVNGSGDYVYPPNDPPPAAPVSQSVAADSDEFAEVHAFWHVNQVYDFVRSLSSAAAPLFPTENIPPFQMRDEKRSPRRLPAVWANVTLPDFQDMQANFNIATMSTRTDKLIRVDNAAFLARENFQQIVIPDYMLDVDTLMIFQGNGADFAYDGPVVWHEFGHGVVTATANFGSFSIDNRSANDEGGAMHEGYADFLAATFGQNPRVGEYVGPRVTASGGPIRQDISAIRSVENTEKCPEVLWGEVHQDSLHFSGALWQARKEHFLGNDQGRTFDAAVYAALVAMNPGTSFAEAAALIAAHVKGAFPADPQAQAKMQAIFDQRGVTNCSKVLDVTGATQPRPYYGIGGTQRAGVSGIVPGPYQMKLRLPNGARTVTVTGQVGASGLFGGAPNVTLLAKVGQPITFQKQGTALTNDADVTAAGQVQNGALTAKVDIAVPCGGEVYFTLGTNSQGGAAVQQVAASFDPATSCAVDAGTDAGLPDAGGGPADAGSTVVEHVGGGAGRTPEGCGCASASSTAAFLALMSALMRRRAPRSAEGR